MSDLRKKLSRSKSAPKKYTIKRAAALIAFIFIFILTSISFSHDQLSSGNSTAIADGQNLVSVFYDGQNKTVATGANTVGEALKKMGITIQNGDVVEPAVNKVLDRGVTNVNIYRALTYTIVDGSKTTVTSSGYRSPRKVIEQQGVVLYPEDSVATERASNFVGDVSVGQKLIIDRATPVKVVLSGKTFEFRTHSKTVKDLLSEKGLEVKPKDIINASIDSPITDNQTIIISRLAQRISTEEIPIPQTEIQNVDSTKPSDYTSVQDPGAPGKKVVSYLITEQDGIEQNRQVLEEKITLAARPRVVVIGPVDTSYKMFIYYNESGNNPIRRNSSGCLGIGQACPGSKLLAVCPDLDYNCEDKFFTDYANQRYGGWYNAYIFWRKNHWW